MAEKDRGVLLTIWLVLMLIGNASVALIYLLAGNFISGFLPSFPLWAVYAYGILSLIHLVLTIFLFKWKKWAFFGVCVMTGIIFVTNLLFAGVVYSALGLIGLIILYLLLRPKWNLLE